MQRYLANKSIETLQENIKNIQIDQKKVGREQRKHKDEANGKQTKTGIPKSTRFTNILISNGLNQASVNHGLKSQISPDACFINKVSFEHSQIHSFTNCPGLLSHCNARRIVAAQTI